MVISKIEVNFKWRFMLGWLGRGHFCLFFFFLFESFNTKSTPIFCVYCFDVVFWLFYFSVCIFERKKSSNRKVIQIDAQPQYSIFFKKKYWEMYMEVQTPNCNLCFQFWHLSFSPFSRIFQKLSNQIEIRIDGQKTLGHDIEVIILCLLFWQFSRIFPNNI